MKIRQIQISKDKVIKNTNLEDSVFSGCEICKTNFVNCNLNMTTFEYCKENEKSYDNSVTKVAEQQKWL